MSQASPSTVAAVLLAAGRSRRFAGPNPKQLVRIGDEPLVRRTARVAHEAGLRVFLVVGHRADAVAEAVAPLEGVARVDNPDYREGQSTSVIAGLRALPPDCAAAIFLPVDQPGLGADLLQALVATWERGDGSIVVPQAEGRRGSPVLFDRRHFEALQHLEGDEGGRQVLARYTDQIATVATAESQLTDIDTHDDLRRWREAHEPKPQPLAPEDFYLEANGLMVFTREYHLKRGFCCKSGCRHCPWGYRQKTSRVELPEDFEVIVRNTTPSKRR